MQSKEPVKAIRFVETRMGVLKAEYYSPNHRGGGKWYPMHMDHAERAIKKGTARLTGTIQP